LSKCSCDFIHSIAPFLSFCAIPVSRLCCRRAPAALPHSAPAADALRLRVQVLLSPFFEKKSGVSPSKIRGEWLEEAGKPPADGSGAGLPKEFLPSLPGFSKQINAFSK
jgi:hypothetical protein